MPVARSKAQHQHLPVTATDLLACDEEQLVQYLKRNYVDEAYDISSLVGVKGLAKSQRDELEQKLSGAALRLEPNVDGLDVDGLFTRLRNLADRQDDPPSLLEPQPSLTESVESTPPPIGFQMLEVSSREELIKDGGRPACSTQELLDMLVEPTTRSKAILPWLSDDPDTETGVGEIKTVFSRQFARWWSFRKSQWSNRGLDDSEEAFTAYLEANRRIYEGIGAQAMASAPSFNETVRRRWQHMPASRQLPDGQPFSVYKNAVQTRLTPHHFTRRPRLMKNPHKQDVWTNWLEYLNFEKWCLEPLLATTAESLEQQSSRPVASSFTRPRRRPRAKTISPAKELEATQAELDASNNNPIHDFVRETKPHKREQAAAFYQMHRVEWVIREARLMEAEMSQQRGTAKRKTKDNRTRESRKRRRDDEEEVVPPESHSQSKRARGGVGSEDAASGATSDRPHTRSLRRSARLAGLQTGV
ncbi:hypothetical protein DV735_g3627, partial [Chaetothyriales sp. CBS 134920]